MCSRQCEPGLEALVGHGACSACAALLLDATLKKKANRPSNQADAAPSRYTNHQHLKAPQAIDRLASVRDTVVRLFREKEKEKRKATALEKKVVRLEAKLSASVSKGNYEKFIRAFQSASEDGLVPDVALQEILLDIAKSLRGKHKWSKTSKSFYRNLLNSGDPWTTKFVSVNLLGMDIRTVQRDRSEKSTEFIAGQAKANMRAAKTFVTDYGMPGCPMAVTEDATSTLARLDGELKSNPDTGLHEVWVEGLEEPLLVPNEPGWEDTLQKQFDAKKEESLARYVYVWTLVPQLPNAPYLPLFMVPTNNRFNSRWVWEWWEFIMAEAVENAIELMGFNSDGDSRLRKADMQLLLHSMCERLHILAADGQPRPFMYLSVGQLGGKHCLAGQDYFHVMMRIRRQLLDANHRLALGRLGLARGAHLTGCPHLLAGDLRYTDKQNWAGVVRIFSMQTKKWLESRLDSDPWIATTLAYIEFGFRLLRMATGDNVAVNVADLPAEEFKTLRVQAVEDAAFCLTFAITWRHWLSNHAPSLVKPTHIEGQYKMETHFITRETFLDVIVMCQCRILMVKLYRERFPTFRIFGDRFSSRFSEYVFQFARMSETNSPSFSVQGFKRHLRHFQLKIDDAVNSGLKMPPSKRGVPNDISRVDLAKYAAPEGWHLTDAEICAALDGCVEHSDGQAIGDCAKWWMDTLACPEVLRTKLRAHKEFFSSPVKHFKKADLWGADIPAAADVEPEEIGREDDDDVVEVEVYDVDEEQDAANIFSRIVERSGQYPIGDGAGGGDTMKFYRDVCDKLKKFNNELIKLAQDRKFRFRVTKLFHGQAKEVDNCDKWEYWSEDDDALLVVQHAGVELQAIGNIREIIVLNELPANKRNLTAGNALRRGTPRDRVPLDFKPDRVVMLLQMYNEVDSTGNVLAGYGNASHKYYHLPMYIEAAPDYWLSESLLGHVRLQPMEKINGRQTDRMYKEKVASDRRDLMNAYMSR